MFERQKVQKGKPGQGLSTLKRSDRSGIRKVKSLRGQDLRDDLEPPGVLAEGWRSGTVDSVRMDGCINGFGQVPSLDSGQL